MSQYIDKDTLVVEIERIKNTEYNGNSISDDVACCALDMVIDAIDFLEVKEVDLEKEINNYISDNFFGSQTLGFFTNRTNKEPNDQDIALCAKHFFELGLKAQKGE